MARDNLQRSWSPQLPVHDLHRWSVPHSVTSCALGLLGVPYPTTVSRATARKLVLGLTRFSFLALREGGVDTMGPETIPIIGAGSFFHFCFFSLLPSAPSCRGAPDFGELFQKNSGYKRESRWEIRTRA